jgi:MFS family permease
MDSLAPTLAKRLPFYYGWVIISVTGLVSFSSIAFGPGVIGALFTPMSDEFGWSRTIVPGALMTGSILVVAVGPLSGRIVDRYGARPIASVGALLMGLCLLGLGVVHSVPVFYALYGIGYAMFIGVTRVAVAATTAQWFVRRRGIASSISNASGAMGFVVLPLLAALVMEQWGWRAGWMTLGTITLIVAVPTSLLLLRAVPSDVGQRVDGDRTESEVSQTSRLGRSATTEVQWTVGEAIKTPTLWFLLIGLSVQGLSSGGVQIHLIPHLEDRGLSIGVAVLAFTIGGGLHVVTAFIWGPLTDRFEIKYIYALAILMMVIHVLSIMLAYHAWMVPVIGFTMGVAFGGTAMVMRVAYANYFGRRSAGAIQGFVTPVQLLVTGAGAIISGALFTATGSYNVPFALFVSMMAVAGFLMLLTPNPIKRSE